MEAIAKYAGGSKFEVEARGHIVIADQPRDNGGEDEGMTPPEFVLATLASCAGYYAVQYLKARALPVGDLEVRVVGEKAAAPARIASFRIEVTTPPLDERNEAGLLKAVKTCLIHNTLISSPRIGVELRTAVQKPYLTQAKLPASLVSPFPL